MTDMTIAKTILEQLGGGQFVAMTGAKNLLGDANSLRFRVPMRTRNGANVVVVRLNAFDTYDVEFISARGVNSSIKGYKEGIYADRLRGLFEDETGLRTSLTKVYGAR